MTSGIRARHKRRGAAVHTLILYSTISFFLPMPFMSVPGVPVLAIVDLVDHPHAGVHVYGPRWQAPFHLEVKVGETWRDIQGLAGPASVQGGVWMTERRGYTAWMLMLPRIPVRQGKSFLVELRLREEPEATCLLLVRW